jgi:two-component system phosphate regulon sensor histidine kinase PhoR
MKEPPMNRSRWLLHPILILILSILALVASLFLYIYWYIEISSGLKSIVQRFNLDTGQVFASQTWVVILVLSILVGVILLGIAMIFVYNLKTFHLYRLQHNFINNFTHELKTPVTSLRLYLETFLKHDLSRKDQLKYSQYMLQDVDRLSENINRILNLAQIESKHYKTGFEALDLVEVVKNFYQKNAHFFTDCDIRFYHPDGASLVALVNLPLFEMLLMNLSTNAVKYNERRLELKIVFEVHQKKIYVRFQDNGIGLEKNEIKKIFKKFYQVGNSEDMSARGSGLGLYVVDLIAKLHNAKIRVQSEGLGKGATFILVMPI